MRDARGCFRVRLFRVQPRAANRLRRCREKRFLGTEQEWLASLKGSDGESAKSPTIDEIYSAWAKQDCNENKSFDDFLKEYLSVSYNENNNTAQIAQNLTSAVSIYCAMYASSDGETGWGFLREAA